MAYRIGQTGHQIPLSDRLGGWHVTGAAGLAAHRGNLTGRLFNGQLTVYTNLPGANFDWQRYPAKSSDLLPHLLLEHQAGFVNRAVEATYRVRTLVHLRAGAFTLEQAKELEDQARSVVDYLLFRDEVPLPKEAVKVDQEFRSEFLKNQRPVHRRSLKDLNLKTRLFEWRCSYMIYSPVFAGMPAELKNAIYQQLDEALRPGGSNVPRASLDEDEKRTIREILRSTLQDLPKGW